MRILFIHYGPFLIARGGGSKCDRQIVEILSRAGHECVVIIPCFGKDSEVFSLHRDRKEQQLQLHGFEVVCLQEGYRNRAGPFRIRALELIRSFDPDCAVVTGSDHGHAILKTVLFSGIRTVYIPRCTWDLCWGPNVPFRDAVAPELVRACHRVLVHSDYMQNYVRKWFSVEASKVKTSLPYTSELLALDRSRPALRKTITCGMINPSRIKGIDILLHLAAATENVNYAVVPGWATTGQDLANLRRVGNIRMVKQFDDPRAFYSNMDVLLVPSVWDEAFGCVAVEAMLSGIPVLASDVGGLPEAKCRVPYLIPIRPITDYRNELDEVGVPIPIVPNQNIEPWERALHDLMQDRETLECLSTKSRCAAAMYAATCNEADLIAMAMSWNDGSDQITKQQ